MARTVLVTGGAGFIGTNYVYHHLERYPEDSIVVLDALTYSGDRANLAEAEAAGVVFIKGQIEDRGLVRGLFGQYKFDWVVNFAAETHVDRSIQDPGLFVRTNVLGTQVLLDAARDYEVERYHQVSTDEVYGDLELDSEELFCETSELKPSSPYSATKAAADHLVLAYHRTYAVPATVSRCSNNYGPYQSVENFIPLFITKAAAEETMPLYGKGENVRDWLFVKDHCEAVLRILEDGCVGEVYCVGGGHEKANLEVAKEICSQLGKSENLIEFVEDRPGHDLRYGVDSSKIQGELGWKPSVSFEEGMQVTLDWYTLKQYERSYSRWRNRIAARATDQNHKQAPASGLQ